MGRNESSLDRLMRAVGAVLLLVSGLFVGAGSTLGIVLFVVAAVLAVTAAVGFCPLYRVLGVSTARRTADRR